MRRLVLSAALSVFPIALLLALPGRTQDGAAAGTVRTIHSADSQMRIAVVGVDDPARVAVLQHWAVEAARATTSVAGRFPLDRARVEIRQRRGRGSSPVPWGQTSRRGTVSVLLYVREGATLPELRGDWTAVHEFSHLFHPFLGREGRWMAEGLASYYQNVLRARAGLLAPADAWRKLDAGFGRGRRATTAVPLSSSSGHRGPMRVYWAGAAYWLQADLALRLRGGSLDAVLARYARCCLEGNAQLSPLAFARALDRIDGHDLFERLYREYAAATRFPDLSASYAALGLDTRDGRLVFDDDPDKARLRAAVMRGD